MSFDTDVRQELAALQAMNQFRETRPLGGPDRARPILSDTSLLAFCSNDYLGLANHPALAVAAAAACASYGFGSGASRLVSGESPLHRELETALAAFTSQEDALLFPSGYQTNLGVITALAKPEDLIVSDAANHASIIDGCRLSRAKVAIYPHADASAAARALSDPTPFRRRFLVTESVFSMDGDRAPLPALDGAVRATGALLIVDEAHALGVAGPGGRGVCAQHQIRPHVLIGTLGKAFGTSGGFAATSIDLRSLLINRARTFIFTTAAPNPVLAASLAALRIIDSPEGDALRAAAAARAIQLRARLAPIGHPVPGLDLILPLLLGTKGRALGVAARLADAGILIPAIRPPTVPDGTARLRITISAAHTEADVDRLATALETALRAA